MKKYASAEELYFARKSGEAFGILLLDVEMSGMTGIDLAKKLRSEGFRGEIISITSHFELAGEGYEVDALHYLVKPVSYEKLSAVLKKATERLSVEPPLSSSKWEEKRLSSTNRRSRRRTAPRAR